MKIFFREYRIEILVFGAAFVARLLALAYGVLHYGNGILQLSDSQAFLDLARAVASGYGYSRDGGLTAFVLRPPGYSFYLAGFFWLFNRFWPAILGQVALSSFVPVFLVRLGKNLMMDSRTVFWAALITALEPHLVIYSITYMSEALFGFLFLASIFYFFRFLCEDALQFLFVSSVLLGISAYVRPVSNYLFFLYPTVMLYYWWGAKDTFRNLLPKVFFV
ncbi:glycosyltransferase family 39 protein, partial [Patescibacteria group bacterium]|nr:glycosyltransferase family 39 protein [Patescibacteria group bacterium]